MIKHRAIFTTLIVIIVLITFFVSVEENSGETIVTIPNDEIPLAKIDVGAIFSTQNPSVDSSSEGALDGFMSPYVHYHGCPFRFMEPVHLSGGQIQHFLRAGSKKREWKQG
jgi:hypothetical protein